MIELISSDKYNAALKICTKLSRSGHKAFFAGGIVRDMLLKKNGSDDIDIASDATPSRISELFIHTIPVGIQFGVMIVVQDGIPFEVATFRSDHGISDGRHPAAVQYTDAENDALRRDFTINGLFYNPDTAEVVDYVGGRDDLAQGIIRAIGNPVERFEEDYLRMLRAIRFAARLGFTIEDATWEALCRNAKKIDRISVERILSELTKMFCSPSPQRALELLDASGLLAVVLPDVAALKGVEQPEQFHPEGDVFEHTRIAMGLLSQNPSPVLAWSVLLHDIGKPATMVEADRIRFNGHDLVGKQLAVALLRRFHAANALIEDVGACIGNHMNFMHVQQMRLGTLKKFLSRSTISEEMELHRIDCMASHGNCENVHFLKEKLVVIKQEALKPEPLLKGRDILELGFKPGPVIGEILGDLYERQLEEEISTREEARAFVVKNYIENRAGAVRSSV